ncbi:MAG TPA: hypothetical protein VLA12_16720 [Planctomycetaceae bacterium]|nr:hypothetical protein [Planctomycetaceae bacterium]
MTFEIFVHRSVHWKDESGWKEFEFVRLMTVPDCWTASMGLMIDSDSDPYFPGEDFRCFVNNSGWVVVVEDKHTVSDRDGECSPEHDIRLWSNNGVGYRWVPRCEHYDLDKEKFLKLPTIEEGISKTFQILSEPPAPA